MTAASPGVIAHFLQNEYYPSREAYLARLVDVMKEEYDAIHRAGFVLQIDCPDLAMGRHLAFPELSNAEFLKIAAGNIEALNHALRDIPRRPHAPAPLLGQLRGPAPPRHPAARDPAASCSRRGRRRSPSRAPTRATSTSGSCSARITLPDDKVIIPGVLDSTTNFIEHPELVAQRIVRYAEVVGRERVIAGSDCGFATFARSQSMVEPEIAWAKLAAMAEGARLASSQLWGTR